MAKAGEDHACQVHRDTDGLPYAGYRYVPMVAAGRGDLDGVRACLVRGGERRCFGAGG
ncbi:hypothetical protein [Streptomyces colonosanans]|uniref:hypothetical protein n=1 Tax=Streptomyces colonosanans TaxID=1428652 RepID=UPI0015A519BE|nr:hypothetical protein [Streptomyces colonosanans]